MKQIILFVMLVLSSTSCKKSGDNQDMYTPFSTSKNYSWAGDKKLIDQLISYYSKTRDEQKLAGNLLIQKSNGSADGTFDENTTISTYIKSDSNSRISFFSKGIDFLIKKESNGVFKLENSHRDKYQFFGETIKVQSNAGVTLRNDTSTTWTASLYVPRPLVVTGLNLTGLEEVSRNVGKTISWIPDNTPANDKGVIIRLRYDALFEKAFPNTEILPIEDMERFIVVSDNGSYQLTSQDLRDFPVPLNSLEISIFRGNYQVFDNANPVALCVFDFFKTYVKLN